MDDERTPERPPPFWPTVTCSTWPPFTHLPRARRPGAETSALERRTRIAELGAIAGVTPRSLWAELAGAASSGSLPHLTYG